MKYRTRRRLIFYAITVADTQIGFKQSCILIAMYKWKLFKLLFFNKIKFNGLKHFIIHYVEDP
jgi:hypothetical protein